MYTLNNVENFKKIFYNEIYFMQKLSKNDELDAILIFNQYINQIQGSY